MSALLITVGRLRPGGAPALDRYAAGVLPLIAAAGGTVIVRGQPRETVVGDQARQPDLVAVIRFRSTTAVREFLESEAYQAYVPDSREAFEDVQSYIATDLMADIMSPYYITPPRPDDLVRIPAIELAAASLLHGHAPASVLAETTSEAELTARWSEGHLWTARTDDELVGFAYVKLIEPAVVHLDEIDVHPAHGRRGVGTLLVRAVCRWAAEAGFQAVTLRTFRAVPWNMPFYAKLGFEEVADLELNAALRALVDDEARRGLDPGRRVTMRWPCDSRQRTNRLA